MIDKKTELNFYNFLLSFISFGFLSLIVKYLVLITHFNLLKIGFSVFILLLFFVMGIFLKPSYKKMEETKNYIFWMFLGCYLVYYILCVNIKLSPSPQQISKLFFLSFLFLPLPFLFSGLILGNILRESENLWNSFKISLFSFSLSPFFIFFILAKRLNSWYIGGTLGIIYLGFLIVFIERGRRRIIPILYVIPIFAFMILGYKTILKKVSAPLKPNICFETKKGVYLIAFGEKKVFFYRNLHPLFSFPYKNDLLEEKMNRILKGRRNKFGNILILGENPKIIDIFLDKGLFKIFYSFEDEGLKNRIYYDYPSIILYMKKTDINILKRNGETFLKNSKLKFDLIIKRDDSVKGLNFYNIKYINLLNKHLKKGGHIFLTTSKNRVKLFSSIKGEKAYNIIYPLIEIFLIFLIILTPPFLFKKRKTLIILFLIVSFVLNFVLSLKLFSFLSDRIYSFTTLSLFLILFPYFLSILILDNLNPSEVRLLLFSLFSIGLAIVFSFYSNSIFFYIFSFLFPFFYFPLYFKRIGGTSGL